MTPQWQSAMPIVRRAKELVPVATGELKRATTRRQRRRLRQIRNTNRDRKADKPGGAFHVIGIADPFNGHIDAFRIAHVQRSDGWIGTTWNDVSDAGAFAVAGAEEQAGGSGDPPPLVVCLMG
jgi:hypothetical protein